MKIHRIVLVLIALSPDAGLAATASSLEQVRLYLETIYPADRPGASVLLVEEGEILHQAGYGLANVELGVPITPDTVFRVGSVTKQFTAAAIMLLQQRGALSVDDHINDYLPDYPTHGHHITIEHLLTHTSGIMSYTSIPGYFGNPVRADLSTEELVDVFAGKPMDFAPGDKWNYNNSGYVLLGAIIEAVSGQSYEDFIAENITLPLGLDDTYYGGPKLIPNRASGYTLDDDDNIVNAAFLSMTQPHAAGSLLSTTGDLAKWHKALTGGEFIHDGSYSRMTTPIELNDGETFPYGYGLGLGTLRGREMISHGGGINGFTCYSLWLPEQDIYVAVLTNGATSGPGPTMVAKMISAMAIGDPYPEKVAITLPESVRNGLVGSYASEGLPPVEVGIEDGALTIAYGESAAEALLAESRDVLFFEDSLAHVEVEWRDDIAERLLFYFNEGAPAEIAERRPD